MGVPGNGVLPPEFERGNLRRDFDAYDPANNFAFLDVSEPSIDHAGFGFSFDNFKRVETYSWLHQPGGRHGRGANLSFLDGPVDGHRWLFTPKRYVPDSIFPPVNALDRQDLMWLIDRTHHGQYRKLQLGLP